MQAVQTGYEHITLNEHGVPIIRGTNMKVVELILEKISYGWSAEELHLQHPYLTLGNIYSALAYYSDHQDKFEEDIEKRLEKIIKLEKETSISPLINRLKSKGLIQ